MSQKYRLTKTKLFHYLCITDLLHNPRKNSNQIYLVKAKFENILKYKKHLRSSIMFGGLKIVDTKGRNLVPY